MNQITKHDEKFTQLALSLIPLIGPKTLNNIKNIYKNKYQANTFSKLWEDMLMGKTAHFLARSSKTVKKNTF